MAAALLAREFPSVSVHSAGTNALIGHAADSIAVELMAERGVDIRNHRARQFEQWMATQADLVLVMDHVQKRFIERRVPSSLGRVYRLGEAAGVQWGSRGGFDVPDPYRLSREMFAECLKTIEDGVLLWAQRING
jgi:protein-tyrosine phosphatase